MKRLFLICLALTLFGQPSYGAQVNTLRIEIFQNQETLIKSFALNCKAGAAKNKKERRICTNLLKIKNPFKEVPSDALCTEIFGGEEFALIKGNWAGKRIDTKISKINGCEIARWERLNFLLK